MPELYEYIKLDELILQAVQSEGNDYEIIKAILVENLHLLNIQTYRPFVDYGTYIRFIAEIYAHQNSRDYEYAPEGRVRGAMPADKPGECQWLECQIEATDKDHIFPKSTLRQTQHMRWVNSQPRGGFERTNWDTFNSTWLCSRHNKNVKNDSIGIGIWLMGILQR